MPREKPLVWMHGEIKSPPFSEDGRLQAGFLLRRLQLGENLAMPHSRPMPGIGKRVHELRVSDEGRAWRIVYRVENDAIVILEVFDKKSERTPKKVIDACKSRIALYEEIAGG